MLEFLIFEFVRVKLGKSVIVNLHFEVSENTLAVNPHEVIQLEEPLLDIGRGD